MEGADILVITGQDDLVDTASKGEKVTVFTDTTPFYAEMGGQVGDKGTITTATGMVRVDKTIHAIGDKIGHVGEVVEGVIQKGQKATMIVDASSRLATARNHTATHLLQKALRNVLGTHVEQAGSLVDPEHLRFDFTHFEPMTKEELKQVESEVNEEVMAALPVTTRVMSLDDARKTGAMALFGEKYGSKVRVVSMGDYSIELCGGTHLTNTAQIGSFKILSEQGSAAGVRRITAVTGTGALAYYQKMEDELDQTASILKAKKEEVAKAALSQQEKIRQLQKEIDSLKDQMASSAASDVLSKAVDVKGVKVLASYEPDLDVASLKVLGDNLKEKLGDSVVILACGKDKLVFVVMATDGAVKRGAHAGNIVREAAKCAGGNGGGRPNMAQAGGKDASKVQDALSKALETAKDLIK